jgi:uncharacterized GH25 family protein
MSGRSKRRAVYLGFALSVLASALYAHDLFIKMNTYFLAPGAAVKVPVLNGTFSSSENAIARARIADLSLVTPAGRSHLGTTIVSARHDTTFLDVRLAGAGTYVLGMSTLPSEIALAGRQFTEYLEEEAIMGIVEQRAKAGISADSARERYSKHVKAIFQVGAERTNDFATALGYPAELVPLDNPYALKPGDTLRIRALVDGRPVAGQPVLAGGRTGTGARIAARQITTNQEGVAALPLTPRGRWYVKFIRMVPKGDNHNYESKWATMTFEVR